MAISWILRQRIRINPNAIFELNSRFMNQEVFEFALKQEYRDFLGVIDRFSNNSDFLNAFMNSKLFTQYGSNLIYPFWNNVPEDMQGQVIDKLIEREININKIPSEIWNKFPRLVIYKLGKSKSQHDWLYLTGDINSVNNYSDDQIREIYTILKDKGVKIKDFAFGWHMSKNNPLQHSKKLMKLFLKEDFSGSIDSLKELYLFDQSTLLVAIKEYFMENLDEAIYSYDKILKLFGYSKTVFTPEENGRIAETSKNAIVSASDISQMGTINFNINYSEEQINQIAEKIAQVTTEVDVRNNKGIYKDFLTHERILKRTSVVKKIFEKNLYIVDYLSRCDIYVNESMLPEEIDENYIPSFETSEVLFTAKPKLFIRSLENNFKKMIGYGHGINVAEFELSDLRRIYEIAKENGYTLNEDSPEFITNNPYFYLEEVKRGNFDRINPKAEKNIPFYKQIVLYSNSPSNGFVFNNSRELSVEEIKRISQDLVSKNILLGPVPIHNFNNIPDGCEHVIKTPQFVIEAIKRDIYTAIYYDMGDSNCKFEEFSDEDLKIMAEEFEKQKSKYPNEVFSKMLNCPLFNKNHYIQVNQYLETGSSACSELDIFTDEDYRKVANFFREHKGKTLKRDNYLIERSNPYLILESIKADPSTIDNIVITSSDKSDEIIDYVIECLKSGKYRFSDRTNPELFMQPKIVDYIINEAEVSELAYLNRIYNYSDIQYGNVINKIFDAVRKGEAIPDVDQFINKPDDIISLCRIDSNSAKFVDLYEVANNEEFIQIMKKAINDGTFIVDENIPYEIWQNEELRRLLFENPNNILYAPILFSKELPEVRKKLLEAIKTESLIVPDKVPYQLFFNKKGDKEEDKIYRYCTSHNPKILEVLAARRNYSQNGKRDFHSKSKQENTTTDLPIEYQTDVDIIAKMIEDDFRLLDRINPSIVYEFNYNILARNKIINVARENNYVLNDNSHWILRNDKNIIINSIKKNPMSIKYALDPGNFTAQEIDEILECIYSSKTPIVLNQNSFDIFKSNIGYIEYSLENATDDEIFGVIDSIDLPISLSKYDEDIIVQKVVESILKGTYSVSKSENQSIINLIFYNINNCLKLIEQDFDSIKHAKIDFLMLNEEEQRRIYEVYLANKDKYSNDLEMHNLMLKNSFYVLDFIRNNPDKVDQIDFSGLRFSDGARAEIRQILLDANYEVNENTPNYWRRDKQFVFKYIQKNNGELKGLKLSDVAPLLDFNEIHDHPEYLALSRYYDQIKTRHSGYFEKWGKEITLEFAVKYGNLIRFMDVNKKPEMEKVEESFTTLLLNRNDLDENEIFEILSVVPVYLPLEFFDRNPRLKKSEQLILKAIDNNVEVFSIYSGNSEKVCKKAVSLGFLKNKNEEQVSKILARNPTFRKSRSIFDNILDDFGLEFAESYTGEDDSIFKKIIDLGYFEGKDEKQAEDFLHYHSNFARSEFIFRELMNRYSVEIVTNYRGADNNIFYEAIKNGLVVDLNFFKKRPDLASDSVLLENGIKNDKYCNCFRLYKSLDNPEKVLQILQSVLGEEFDKIVVDERIKNEILGLCSICDNPVASVKFLKCLDFNLIEGLGFNEWKKFIKYSINNKDIDKLINIIDKGEVSNFLEIYETLKQFVNDDKALGVNKFIRFADFYDDNSELLKHLAKDVNEGKELSIEQKSDLYILMYSRNAKDRESFNVEDLGKLTQIERDNMLKKLKFCSGQMIKDDLGKFLFNMDSLQITLLLNSDISTKTIVQMMNRAIKDENEELELNSKYMFVLIDLLEQFQAADSDESFKDFARRVYQSDIRELAQIRKTFSNINEIVRCFYEREAQLELTNLSTLINNPEFVEMDKDDIIIDLSKSRHTLYGHILSTDLESFFNQDHGKVIISVSNETDKHEGYYDNDTTKKIILCIDSLPNGAFIGSSINNMSSGFRIGNNDYNDSEAHKVFNQTSIRNSYDETEKLKYIHTETLLYRYGLIPSGIIMRYDQPLDIEREQRKKLEEIINKGIDPNSKDYRRVPLIRTQHSKNRVFLYDKSLPKEMLQTEVGTKQEERIDELRKKFSNIFGFGESSLFERNDGKNQPYVIIDDKIYNILNLSEREEGAMMAASRLQSLIRDDSDYALDIKRITLKNINGENEKVNVVRDVDARSMWKYNRKNGSLSHKTSKMFLQEFLIDHLLCNYVSDNDAFLLDEEENVYGINKGNSCKAVDDFKSEDGNIYTSMSYYYFDSSKGNNIYRKIFESYILAPECEEIFTDEDLNDFIDRASKISRMDDSEYFGIFEEMLNSITDDVTREKVEKMLLARKQNVGRDSKEFVERLKVLRETEQEPEIIEDSNSVAFICDIHGNLEALQALLKECKKNNKKDLFILGDMIGFGPQSNECIDLIRQASNEFNVRCVLGNHELYSLMGNKSFYNTYGFQPELTTSIRQSLSVENRKFIESMPITRKVIIDGKKVELTHFPIKRFYEDDSVMYIGHQGLKFEKIDSGKNQDVLIYGHEHRTELTTGDDVGTIGKTKVGNTEFVNLPSSGCVHGRKTSYVTISFKNNKIEYEVNGVDYDRDKLQDALIKTGNPNAFLFGGERR